MDLETLKYWRTVPLHIDNSQMTDLALYKRDSKELVDNIQERYTYFLERINQMIRMNRTYISNRMFRNRLFQASVERTHAGVMHLIKETNEQIQREAEEATTRLEEQQLTLQTAIEENQQNAVDVIQKQIDIIAEYKDEMNTAIQEARAVMEQTSE